MSAFFNSKPQTIYSNPYTLASSDPTRRYFSTSPHLPNYVEPKARQLIREEMDYHNADVDLLVSVIKQRDFSIRELDQKLVRADIEAERLRIENVKLRSLIPKYQNELNVADKLVTQLADSLDTHPKKEKLKMPDWVVDEILRRSRNKNPDGMRDLAYEKTPEYRLIPKNVLERGVEDWELPDWVIDQKIERLERGEDREKGETTIIVPKWLAGAMLLDTQPEESAYKLYDPYFELHESLVKELRERGIEEVEDEDGTKSRRRKRRRKRRRSRSRSK